MSITPETNFIVLWIIWSGEGVVENIRPIRSEADYEWAIAEVALYFENEPKVGSADGDRFDVLSDLIEAYENRHYAIETLDPVGTIKAHMELMGLNQAALADVLGSRARASEILNRKRPLTLDMIFKINREWRIPSDALIRPYHVDARTGKTAA